MKNSSEAIRRGVIPSLNGRARLLFLLAALVGLGVFVYGGALSDLFFSVLQREGSSHGLFVPFISGYFLWLRRKRIREADLDFSFLPGAAMVVAGIVMLLLSRSSTEVALPALSFLLVGSGLVMAFLGMRVFKAVCFPLLFLATMVPVPRPLYDQIGAWMQAANTAGSVWFMQLFQLPIYREGFNIYLPNINLFVDASCSGIRYLLSFFVFSIAYAFLWKRSVKARTMVVLASFPMAFVGGVLRLSSIYVACYFIGPFMAGHWPHVLLSWLVFLAVLAGAIGLDQSISKGHGAEGRGH